MLTLAASESVQHEAIRIVSIILSLHLLDASEYKDIFYICFKSIVVF